MFRYKIIVMSSANRSRKYESGYQKRKKKQRIDDLTQSQKGAMDKFVRKESQVSTDNDDNDPRDGQIETENIIGVEEVLIDNTNIEMDSNADNIGANSTSPIADVNDSFQPDIFDPRYWDSLDHKQIDILAEKSPRRDLSIQKGPKDRYARRFSALFYTRILSNGEHCNRDWLVYSTELDRVFYQMYLLLIKQFPQLQEDLNNTRVTNKILISYLPLKHYSHWMTRV